MKFKGLNGRDFTVNVHKYRVIADNDGRQKRSAPHRKARTLLQDKFKSYQILEEMKISNSNARNLYLDFFIPTLSLAIEVNGRQHYEFVAHFHKGRAGWIDALRRDRIKREWCELNDIHLVVFRWDEEDDWGKQI